MDALKALLLAVLLATASVAFAQDAALVDAVKKNNAAEVSRLLAAGANPNAKDAEGFPVLANAIVEHHNQVFTLLVKAGADVKATFRNSSMAQLAEMSANKEVSDFLQNGGPFPSARGPSTDEIAKQEKRREIAAASRKLGFPGDRKGFYEAIRQNRTDVIELMLQLHDIQVDLSQGNTPLHVAAYEGALDSAKLLVERGANVNAKNKAGTPVLWYSISRKHEAVQKFLESKGAKLE